MTKAWKLKTKDIVLIPEDVPLGPYTDIIGSRERASFSCISAPTKRGKL
jgi:hypothetical protein